MAARNGPDSFGWVSRGIHWLMALGLIGALAFGSYLARIEPSFDTLWMYGAHKSVGITLLVLVLIRLAWHRFSPPPVAISAGIPGWQVRAAAWSHRLLYLLMVLVPLSGWVGSSGTGIPTVIFGQITLPAIAPATEFWDTAGFTAHSVLTKALFALILLHLAGALSHVVLHRDATLRRIVRGR
ncbi:cytochrome b [Ponticoccus sp. SC2-23]|uniref:cytochrome b n=1 Tax=Alexandriicola marinus TaxID=2081710 RepID=UPI000FD863F6|nr:cytochrome b [Alexandriicola marinus]MBM1221574.1 cytochrome b [Ponticoccus sp. SC6-9]MBM1226615.1 cytochrome b [Ponticoccus sp. SC6-15]MBM1230566.1 cytochrome b [Ponticoccus sp. SC6-38]MBM1235089.1 cytochrome b [Ponticoccus sp. SC6-45]MBM1239587.1 cytochrome b [Ponticoccus sp. SC6-49]MBM1243369.1 cytochrome b [Ponticoccus sp. SC2-64]MBM1248613.1 cytochrome b [Ponticoccus sp. SC6-42]MBM1253198.1 cytochrome b [Ponticoccus sp. SC6-33]MBM1257596.1 cytochrome b [Ponticoccus sp. SC6-60]MBM1